MTLPLTPGERCPCDLRPTADDLEGTRGLRRVDAQVGGRVGVRARVRVRVRVRWFGFGG